MYTYCKYHALLIVLSMSMLSLCIYYRVLISLNNEKLGLGLEDDS